tara:strand:- start:4783 stop:5475 length:693 start_codon:yes stop_codon:yes gene_type:complete
MSHPRVLFCNPLSETYQNYLLNTASFNYDIIGFISFKELYINEWLSEASHNAEHWVFTSKNAVKAVFKHNNRLNIPKSIFCIGPKTAFSINEQKLSPLIRFPNKYNSKALIELILNSNANLITHFKGDLSPDYLVQILNKNGRHAKSVVVYRTKKRKEKVSPDLYDGLVFMSPSAVHAFLESNNPSSEAPVFCIGHYTGMAATNSGFNKVIVTNKATFEHLVKTIEDYII